MLSVSAVLLILTTFQTDSAIVRFWAARPLLYAVLVSGVSMTLVGLVVYSFSALNVSYVAFIVSATLYNLVSIVFRLSEGVRFYAIQLLLLPIVNLVVLVIFLGESAEATDVLLVYAFGYIVAILLMSAYMVLSGKRLARLQIPEIGIRDFCFYAMGLLPLSVSSTFAAQFVRIFSENSQIDEFVQIMVLMKLFTLHIVYNQTVRITWQVDKISSENFFQSDVKVKIRNYFIACLGLLVGIAVLSYLYSMYFSEIFWFSVIHAPILSLCLAIRGINIILQPGIALLDRNAHAGFVQVATYIVFSILAFWMELELKGILSAYLVAELICLLGVLYLLRGANHAT